MRLARVALLAVALGSGVVAAFLAVNLTSAPAPEPIQVAVAATAPDTVDILVASGEIAIGTTVGAGSLRWIPWPRDGVMASYIQRMQRPEAPSEIDGWVARDSFFPGEPVTEAKLVSTGSGFMSAILPPGMRAVATPIAADTSAGGFILPNDRVDVIMTRRGGDNQYITETVLHDVRILAIDQTVEDRAGREVVVGRTATLELSPEQAEILTVAQQMGERLTLALRSVADALTGPAEATGDAFHLIGGPSSNGSIAVIRNGVLQEVMMAR